MIRIDLFYITRNVKILSTYYIKIKSRFTIALIFPGNLLNLSKNGEILTHQTIDRKKKLVSK